MDKRHLNIERSILFRRLLQNNRYRSALNQRWITLNEQNILSEEGLKKRITSKRSIIRKAVDKNFALWSVDSDYYYDNNGFEQEVDLMLEFITLRHQRLIDYFKTIEQ